MAPKRKRGQHQQKQKSSNGGWRAMTIESAEGLTNDDFAGLVGLEELHDYELKDAGNGLKMVNYGHVDVDEQSQMPTTIAKKKKNKKQKTTAEFEIVKISDADVIGSDPSKAVNQHEEAEEEEQQQEIDDDLVDMTEWETLSVPDHIIQCLRAHQMYHPTPIQKATISDAITDRSDVYGAAPTGSGKTLAFAIPLVHHIADERRLSVDQDSRQLRGLVLTPTRELAVQIKKHIESITAGSNIQTGLLVGGLAVQKQERVLRRLQPDIVVATPGRLWDIINSGSVPYLSRESLARVRYLVIDEADRMIDRSHFEELKLLIELLTEVSKARQTFIFSATLTMQKAKNKAKKRKNKDAEDPDLISLLQLDRARLKVVDLTEGGSKATPTGELLEERIIHCMQADKDLYLYYFLLQNPGRSLVFCNSIDCIRRLQNILRFLALSPMVVHSSMQQKRRLQAIERFTASPRAILLATDVASRGLDIPSVNHVIHYQCPRTADIYVHRSGRTARIGQRGTSLILCDPQEEAFFLKDMFRILRRRPTELAEYQTNSLILKRLKERIRLALACDQIEHSLRKVRTQDDWFRKAAKACEMDDSDDEVDPNSGDLGDATPAAREYADNNRKLAALRGQLRALLKSSGPRADS